MGPEITPDRSEQIAQAWIKRGRKGTLEQIAETYKNISVYADQIGCNKPSPSFPSSCERLEATLDALKELAIFRAIFPGEPLKTFIRPQAVPLKK